MRTYHKYLQIVNRRKPRPIRYLRALPYTVEDPTIPQIKARIAFGEAARRMRGVKYKGKLKPGEIPPAAKAVQSLRGVRFGRTARYPKWVSVLSEVLREEGLSEEEAIRIYETLRNPEREVRSYQEVCFREEKRGVRYLQKPRL